VNAHESVMNVQARQLDILVRLVQSMALGIPRERLPEDERDMLDYVLEREP
jgi:hypothetical protein